MISKSFVEYWLKKYDQTKYSATFFDQHAARLVPGMTTNEFRETLIALLHWKDGKANLYSPGNYTAKPNTINPILLLPPQSTDNFGSKFFEFRARPTLTDRGENFFRYLQNNLWRTIVLPVFVMHLARPLEVPIVDQHVVRAMRFLYGDISNLQKVRLTWTDYEAYYDFFASIANELDLGRRQIDMALWAWGKELKQVTDAIDEEEDLVANEDRIGLPQVNKVSSKPESAETYHLGETTAISAHDHLILWGQRLSTEIVPTSCNIHTALQHLLEYRNSGPDLVPWEKTNMRQLGAYDWPGETISEILNVSGGSAAKSILLEFKSKFEQDHDQNEIPRCIRNVFLVGTFPRLVGHSIRSQFILWAREHGFGGTDGATGAIYQVGITAGKVFGLLNDYAEPTVLFREYFEV